MWLMPYLEVNKQAVAKILQNPVASQEPKSSCFPEEERQRRLTIAQDHLETSLCDVAVESARRNDVKPRIAHYCLKAPRKCGVCNM